MVHVLMVVLLACAATRTVQSYDYYDYYDANADDAPVLTVHKYCRIPRLKQMQIVHQETDKPWEFAGALVPSGISDSLFYKCDSSTDWKRVNCFDGQWHPHIPTHCIDHTCYLETTRKDKEPNTTAIIPCTGGITGNYKLSMTCSSSGGYWFPPGCGEHMNAKKRGFTFDRIAYQPLQPVKLTANAKSTIVLCPKGQELMRCVSAGIADDNCTPFNEAFLLSSQDESPIMLSGLEITSSTNFTKKKNRDKLKCKDVDECKVIKWDNANSTAAGKPQYLNERGILKCGDEASCENTECKDPNTCEGYQCKCRESWEFNEADRSCKFMECSTIPETARRTAWIMQKRIAFISCPDDGFDLKPEHYNQLECKHGKWTVAGKVVDGELPKCVMSSKYCASPTVPANGMVLGSFLVDRAYQKDDQAHYRCKSSYVMDGEDRRTCKLGGYWSGSIPTCTENLGVLNFASDLRKSYIDGHTERTQASGIDIAFLIDTSNSVRGQESLNKMLCLCKAIVHELFSPDILRVSIITFGHEAVRQMDFTDARQGDLTRVKSVFNNIKFNGGSAMLKKAVRDYRRVIEGLKNTDKNSSRNATSVAVLLTDGYTSTEQDPTTALQGLRTGQSSLVDVMVAIGVGRYTHNSNLQKYVDFFPTKRMYTMNRWDDMTGLVEKLYNKNKRLEMCGFAGNTEKDSEALKTDRYRYNEDGRREVPEGSWPWLVGVFVNEWFIGAGNLICEQWVITTNSTLTDSATGQRYQKEKVSLQFGMHYMNLDAGDVPYIQTAQVEAIIPHPDRDLALVKLSSPVRLSDRVSTVCLLDEEDMIFGEQLNGTVFSGLDAYFVGWGANEVEFGRDKTGKNITVLPCPEANQTEGAAAENATQQNLCIVNQTEGAAAENATHLCIVNQTEGAAAENATHLCIVGENETLGQIEDRGGALLYKQNDFITQEGNDVPRYVALALAKPREDYDGPGVFESLLGVGEWLHNVTGRCNQKHIVVQETDYC